MATNRIYADSNKTSPALAFVGPNARAGQLPLSGDPCVFGQVPGVASGNPDANNLTVAFLDGIFELPVKAEGGAITVGEIIYFDAADAVTSLNDDNTGVRFGYALQAIGNGLTATILVKVGY